MQGSQEPRAEVLPQRAMHQRWALSRQTEGKQRHPQTGVAPSHSRIRAQALLLRVKGALHPLPSPVHSSCTPERPLCFQGDVSGHCCGPPEVPLCRRGRQLREMVLPDYVAL